jgi:cytochrome bd-type quinol oxidase subunit 2
MLFVFFAVQNINEDGGWGFFTIILVIMATFDLGAGIRMIRLHFFIKGQSKK